MSIERPRAPGVRNRRYLLHLVVALWVIAGCKTVDSADSRPRPLQALKDKLSAPGPSRRYGAPNVHRRDMRRQGLLRGQNPVDTDNLPNGATRRNSSRSPLGLPPLSELLDDTPTPAEDETTFFPGERGEFDQPDIRSPGPDTANFPNSPYTLPQGRAYVEASPVVLSGPSRGTAATFNMEYLLRYGLTDRLELRIFGNGPTWQWGRPGTTNGFAPIAWDLKTNFWRENTKYFIPATGLEVAISTPTGSPGLNQGYQPLANLLFDWSLPADWMLEVNVGFAGDPSVNNSFNTLEATAQWSLQRELFKDFDVFFQGYFNGSAVPRYGDGVVLGGGAVWAINSRLSVFGSYNAGVSDEAPTTMLLLGGAIAF